MREELIAQLNAWHEADEYEEIVSRIKEVPTPLIDEELAVHLGPGAQQSGAATGKRLNGSTRRQIRVKKTRCGISVSATPTIIWMSTTRRSRRSRRRTSWTLKIRIPSNSWNGAAVRRRRWPLQTRIARMQTKLPKRIPARIPVLMQNRMRQKRLSTRA